MKFTETDLKNCFIVDSDIFTEVKEVIEAVRRVVGK